MVPPAPVKRKVAILGGGIGALSAAFGLTSEPGWQNRLDVTVYSLGWRLGGKGATGRDPQHGYRIQEHGLHMWFGFYDEAFGVMRQVYRELNRVPEAPLSTFEQAFLPQDIYAMEHEFNGKWYHWNIYMPPNNRTPGDSRPLTLWDYLVEAMRLLTHAVTGQFPGGKVDWQHKSEDKIAGGLFNRLLDDASHILSSVIHPAELLQKAYELMHGLSKHEGGTSQHKGRSFPILTALIRAALKAVHVLLGNSIETDLLAYRAWIAIDMLGTIIIGALSDDLMHNGFSSINHSDWETWLTKHGLSPVTLASCLVQVGYDSSFGFFKGRYNMEAGTCLSGAIKLYLDYKGSIVYRFAAGTGDTVFGPLYECLKQRGVKFQLFTQVTEVVADNNGAIEQVKYNRQMQLKGTEYDPFIVVKGLKCWPAEPKYEQLVNGEALQKSGQDLESYWSTWTGTPQVMRRGVDFDDVICGISVASLPALTPTLAERNPAWKQMLEKIKTTRTQAFQLWFKPTLQELGWPFDKAIISCNGEPVDSWADLSCTVPFEDWQLPAPLQPHSVQYFCGAMIDPPDELPGPDAKDYPEKQDARAKKMALEYIHDKLERTLPNAFKNGQFIWDLLADPEPGRSGETRFDSQWWRANIDPSERYVLSVVDSGRYRLRSDGSGFSNLYLAGDWTDNGIVNAGCMEAAALSGMQAAEALLHNVATEIPAPPQRAKVG